MISEPSFMVRRPMKVTKVNYKKVSLTKMRNFMEPYQISILLEDHLSIKSRLFRSNSMLRFSTLETNTWRDAQSLLKLLTT